MLVSSQLFDIEQVAALKKVESEAQFALRKLKAEDAAEVETTDHKALIASQKEMKEWLRGHRVHDYAADVTRIAGEYVTTLFSLPDCVTRVLALLDLLLAGRNVVPSDLQYLTDENVEEIGTRCLITSLLCCS